MIPISNFAHNAVFTIENTQSPIETELLNAMMLSGKFVFCRDGDEPMGEGNFIFAQKHVGPYRADFIIRSIAYRSAKRVWPPLFHKSICVECDGREYHTSPEHKEYDRKRDEFFLEHGLKTMRFTGWDIKNFPMDCVKHILDELSKNMEKMGE